MATRSRPKNFPRGPGHQAPSKEQQLSELPVPVKPHPGYPGHGPPLPGRDYKSGAGAEVSARTPPGTERYYPGWSGENIKSNQVSRSRQQEKT